MNYEHIFGLVTNYGLSYKATTDHDSRILSPITDHEKPFTTLCKQLSRFTSAADYLNRTDEFSKEMTHYYWYQFFFNKLFVQMELSSTIFSLLLLLLSLLSMLLDNKCYDNAYLQYNFSTKFYAG